MNLIKSTLAASLLLGTAGFVSAEEPSIFWHSVGYFNPSGWYPMAYHVYTHDNDGDLQQLRVDAHWEMYNFWTTDYGYGNGFDKEIHQWGESIDGYSWAHVYITDSVDTYHHEIELYF